VLLVDHQFHNGSLFGWNEAFRADWVRSLHEITRALGKRLTVKLHPGDRSNAWAPYLHDGVSITTDGDIRELAARTELILGTFSTMQLPLAAMKHTTMVSLEIHPEAGHFPSAALVRAGVSEAARSFDELRALLARTGELKQRQAGMKAAFEEQFLHRFDGRSGERLARALAAG
jgi:hypothetical protein